MKSITKKKLLSEFISLSICILVVLMVKSSLICNYTVPTGSMTPTILPGDKLVVNKMAYRLRIPFTERTIFEFDKPSKGEIFVLFLFVELLLL